MTGVVSQDPRRAGLLRSSPHPLAPAAPSLCIQARLGLVDPVYKLWGWFAVDVGNKQ